MGLRQVKNEPQKLSLTRLPWKYVLQQEQWYQQMWLVLVGLFVIASLVAPMSLLVTIPAGMVYTLYVVQLLFVAAAYSRARLAAYCFSPEQTFVIVLIHLSSMALVYWWYSHDIQPYDRLYYNIWALVIAIDRIRIMYWNILYRCYIIGLLPRRTDTKYVDEYE